MDLSVLVPLCAAMSRSPSPTDSEPRSYNVAGIDVKVWGMDRLSPDREVAAMFFLHGRTSSKDAVESMAFLLVDVSCCPDHQ
jgi:hypothetical protein